MNELQLTNVKGLSHNINTPLTTILGYVSLIKKKSTDKNILDWTDSIKTEVLKISKYSKEIDNIIFKNCP